MITTQQELIETFTALPPEAQRQALNFIAFLQQTYAPVTVSPNIAVKSLNITTQHQKLTLSDLISSIPNNFTYPDDVMEFTESEPLRHELPEIDWEAKWEKWFEECETMPISTTTHPPQNDYTALLIDKYRKQGLEL